MTLITHFIDLSSSEPSLISKNNIFIRIDLTKIHVLSGAHQDWQHGFIIDIL